MHVPIKIGDVWQAMQGRCLEDPELKIIIKNVVDLAGPAEYDWSTSTIQPSNKTCVVYMDLVGQEWQLDEHTFRNLYWKPF